VIILHIEAKIVSQQLVKHCGLIRVIMEENVSQIKLLWNKNKKKTATILKFISIVNASMGIMAICV
jgi:hypothetical protein